MLYTKRLDREFRPLEYVESIDPVGNVPSIQQYDSDFNEYTPDYGLSLNGGYVSPLVLQPHVYAHEKGGDEGDSEVTAQLADMRWTEIIANGSTVTSTLCQNVMYEGHEAYTVVTSGANIGRLYIHRNFQVGTAVTLRFEASHVDTRDNSIHTVNMEFPVLCVQGIMAPLRLDVDCLETFAWNPLRESPYRTITARLLRGARVQSGITFHWCKRRSNDAYTALGSDIYDDLGYSISQDTSQLSLDMSLMGESLELLVWAEYGGVTTYSDSVPSKQLKLMRLMPKVTPGYVGVPSNIEEDTVEVYPKLLVTDGVGVITDPLKEFVVEWKVASGVPGAQSHSYTVVDKNVTEPVIATSRMNANGMMLGVELTDRGARKRIVHGGKQVVHNGKVVINR